MSTEQQSKKKKIEMVEHKPIIFPIILYYFRVLDPNQQQLADTNARPMLLAMTDNSQGAPAMLHDEQESLHSSQNIQLNKDYYTYYMFY